MMRNLRIVRVAAVLLFLSALVTACGVRAYTFELPQRQAGTRNVCPWRVGVVVDKEFMPYKIKFKYWSTPNFTSSFAGLPDAFVETLRPYFLSVERRQVGPGISEEHYDLLARMSIDGLRFDRANTTVSENKVDLAMTFTFEQGDGTEVYETTVSESASRLYSQRCVFLQARSS